MKICFRIVICLLVIQSAFAQRYNLRNYTIEDGLPQSQVFDIFQDSKGYLWLATKGGGIARFDGKKFTVFTTENGLADNQASKIIEDKNGNILVATNNGVSKFNGKKFINYGKKEGLAGPVILTLYQDSKGRTWAGTEKAGLYVADSLKTFRKISLPEHWGSGDNETFRTLAEDKGGTVWCGSDYGIFNYSNSSIDVLHSYNSGLCGNGIWSILRDSNNCIWFGVYGEFLCSFDGRNWKHYGAETGITNDAVICLFEDDERNLWIGTDGGGLFKMTNKDPLNRKIVLHMTEKNGLPSNRIRCVKQDKEGNIWIGTDGGLSKFDRGTFVTYTANDGLKSNYVLSFLEDSAKDIYVGTEAGIHKYNPGGQPHFIPCEKVKDDFVWTLEEDRSGNLWAGTYRNGLYKSDKKSGGKFLFQKKLPNGNIFALKKDNKDRLWIGSDLGVYVLSGDSVSIFKSSKLVSRCRVRSICVDKSNNVWFGTKSGLLKYTADSTPPAAEHFSKVKISENVDNGTIHSVLQDEKGFVWIGTYGFGLIRLDPDNNSYKTISSADGLSHNNILSMVFEENYLWIGTINGLNRFDYSSYNETGKKEFRYFGKTEGFSGIEVNQNSVLLDSKGNLWFGTGAGAVKYDPKYDRKNTNEAVTHINGLRLFFEDTDWSRYSDTTVKNSVLPVNLELPYNKNHITFDFIGICLTGPEKVRYRFMLEGLDHGWLPVTTETYASYPGLPPGEYTFKVEACNNEGIWNSHAATYHFVILPPIWKRAWFYVLASALALALTFGYSAFRNYKLKKQKRFLEEQVQLRTAELHTKNEALEAQKKIIEEKNKDIISSIYYAQRIQQALFASEKYIERTLKQLRKR